MRISYIHARQIIDSRATPTLEVDIWLNDKGFGRAAVPSGASTGSHEALELRDNDPKNFLGRSVNNAVDNVLKIGEELKKHDFASQSDLDTFLIEQDGTKNKSKLGANTILAISLAFAWAAADLESQSLYVYINKLAGEPKISLPRPMFNIMNGGRHAAWATDIQEFMVIIKNRTYVEQLRAGCEIYASLGKLLEEKGLSTLVGNEGGYAPGFKNNTDALDTLLSAIEKAGYLPGVDVFFALDVAASEFYSKEKNMYELKTEGKSYSPGDWHTKMVEIVNKYPMISIEDPFSEDDWESWQKFNNDLGRQIQIVGDDLLVTNLQRVEEAIEKSACNSLLVKPNQIGSLTETLQAMKKATDAGWTSVVSHRSGETEDVTIAHLAVGTGAGQIKTGAPSRGERTAKYNELIRIAEELS